MQIPTRIAEAIKNNELQAEDYYDLYGKENVDQAVADLRKSDEQILEQYSIEDMKTAVLNKMNAAQNKQQAAKPKVIPFAKVTRITLAAAAVLAAAIVLPVTLSEKKNYTEETIPLTQTQGVRLKGAAKSIVPALTLYRQEGKEAEKLANGAKAEEGDVIQITYNAGQRKYGFIFSVDGNGNVTQHFPEEGWESAELSKESTEVPLDFSYELDDAPDFECFILVTSNKPFSLENIEGKLLDRTSLAYIEKMSYLPRNTEGKSFLLVK